MTRFDFRDKTVLVTGGAQGIGRGIVVDGGATLPETTVSLDGAA